MPVPDKLTVCVFGEELSAIVSVPVRLPPAVGLKVTVMKQLEPAAKLEPQVFVWAKSPLAEIPEIVRAALPPLVSLICWPGPKVPIS